jgi:hypothetical protein
MSEINIKSLLPAIKFEITESMTESELFQNQTLRPILKFQGPGLCRLTLMYCFQMNPNFGSLSGTKKRKMLNDLLSGNQALRNHLIGMIISFFDKQEWDFYSKLQKDINKRILAMIQVRVLDSYEKFMPSSN